MENDDPTGMKHNLDPTSIPMHSETEGRSFDFANKQLKDSQDGPMALYLAAGSGYFMAITWILASDRI